ncbi:MULTISPECIES: 3'-5' exonuclease [unclassified Microcoleus]|uniref:3'-5' exonuclease n=1 Tax=unclassified Microcoleus TaxID=2642155 RepID=UPI002FD535FF
MSLPRAIGRQKEVLYLPPQGHLAVLGTAGSGKTTLAILRSAYLASSTTEHFGKTLLVTFNNTLVSYLKRLQDDQLADVVIENYHKFARGYLASRGKLSRKSILDPERREELVKQAVETVSRKHGQNWLLNNRLQVFSEEIQWIIQHGITSLEDYQNFHTVGHIGTRIEYSERELMFEIYQTYSKLRQQLGMQYDWDNLASAVCAELDADRSPRRYRHIIIDEGQDFSPEMIRSLAKAIPPNGSLTFFGDVAQQIYGHRMSWREAGLNITKPWEFKENYRNTKQIAKLGLAISEMPYFRDVRDLVEPVSPNADGPRPTIVKFASIQQEITFIVQQASEIARTQSVAILVRDGHYADRIIRQLQRSVNLVNLDLDIKAWKTEQGIQYCGTYHSAKGLEFGTVILPFCNNQLLPDPKEVTAFGETDAMAKAGRLLYVGVTRARSRLIITYSGELTRLLPTDESLYLKVSL